MKNIFALLLSISLIGCAFGKDPSSENKEEVQERQKLSDTYSKVKGVYAGPLFTGSANHDIELSIFTEDVKQGVNSDGTDRFRLVLKGTYTRINPAGASQTLDGRFIPETGELILSNPRNDLGPDDVKSINAKLEGNKLVGEVKRSTGVIGQFVLELSSQESRVPDTNERERTNERIRQTLKKIVGKYEGVVLPPPQLEAPFAIEVELFINEVVGPNGTTPTLAAYYRLVDDTTGSSDLPMTASYDAELSPAKLTLNGQGALNYAVTLEGYLTPSGAIRGSLKNQKGFVGNVELKKQ